METTQHNASNGGTTMMKAGKKKPIETNPKSQLWHDEFYCANHGDKEEEAIERAKMLGLDVILWDGEYYSDHKDNVREQDDVIYEG